MTRQSLRSVVCIVLLLWGIALGAESTSAPLTPQGLLEAGNALAMKQDRVGAIVQYDAALKLDPNFAAGHAYKAASLLALGKPDEADAEIQQALKHDEKAFAYWEIAGQVKIVQGKIEEGRGQYNKAAALSPADAGAIYTDLAAALAERKDDRLTSMIEAALRAAATAIPPGPEALFQLGQSYAQAGKAEGKKFLQRYIEVSKDLPEAQRDPQKLRVAKQLIRALDILQQ